MLDVADEGGMAGLGFERAFFRSARLIGPNTPATPAGSREDYEEGYRPQRRPATRH